MENGVGFRGWKAAPFVFATEACQSAVYATLALNLFLYAVNDLHYEYVDASKVLTNFCGTATLLTLLGGFLSDAYISQFTAVLIGQALSLIGTVTLTVSAMLPKLKPPPCIFPSPTCLKPSVEQEAVFYSGLYSLALGLAMMRPNAPTLGAAQFDELDPHQMKQLQSYFNWFLFSSCLGALPAVTVISYIQEKVASGWGFGIPAICIGVSVFVICSGWPYRAKERKGSVFTRISKVMVAAARNWRLQLPPAELLHEDEDGESNRGTLAHTTQFRFLDRAAIVTGKSSSPWRLCGVTQVEEVKALLRILPIFGCTIILSCVLAQLQTFTIAQVTLLDRKLGDDFEFPAASLAAFPLLTMLLLLPLYDRFFVPFARKISGHERGITHLQRLGLGLAICTLSMVAAALVETKRLRVAGQHGGELILPMSGLWMVLQFLIFGIAEMFTVASLLDFFYTECPTNMRTMGISLMNVSLSFGYFLSSIIVSIVNKCTHPQWLPPNLNAGKLNYFYWTLAVLSAINFLNYLYWSWWYKPREQVDFADPVKSHNSDTSLDHSKIISAVP